MNSSRNKYLIKNTLVFILGNLGSKLISFFLIPLYTNALTTTQYGTADLVTTVSTVAVPILTLNICESVMRFALDKNADTRQITQIGTNIFLIGCIIGLLIIPICSCFEQISQYSALVYFYVISLAASQLYLCDLRGKELLLQYSIGNILHTLMIAIFNILFLMVFKQGIQVYLLAYILSNVITTVYAIYVGKGYKSFGFRKVNKSLLVNMAKYSIVLIPNSFMWWIMNSSDRIMVSSMVGIAANGIYAVSYKLPTLVSTLTAIFNQAWSYSAIKEKGALDENEYNNRVFKMLITIVMTIGIGLMTFIKPFLKVYVTPEYFSAWEYTPFLIIGCVYLTMGTFMGTSYTVHKDSFGYLFSGMFGAVLNVILNFLLIPVIEVYGAAIATCISYMCVFCFRLIHTRKYITYKVNNIPFACGTVILILSGALMFWNSAFGVAFQIVLFIVYLCLVSKVWLPMIKKAAKALKWKKR